jgi:hypothetical protein
MGAQRSPELLCTLPGGPRFSPSPGTFLFMLP